MPAHAQIDQRRETARENVVKVAPLVALTAWSRPTMTRSAESGSRRNRKNLYVLRGLISSDLISSRFHIGTGCSTSSEV